MNWGILQLSWTITIMLISSNWSILNAQNTPKFKSHKLEEIASQLSASYHINCAPSQTAKLKEIPLIVTVDKFHTINHIGFKLFDRLIIEQNPSPIYEFVERFLLELYLIEDNTKISEYLQESKVIVQTEQIGKKGIYSNLQEVLSKINSNLSIIITTDNNKYTITWFQNKNNLVLSLRFPIQYELLWGMNKAESENQFYSDLLNYQKEYSSAIFNSNLDMSSLKAINDSCFYTCNDSYGIDAITSNQYYRKVSNEKYRQLSDSNYPAESISNLFTIKANNQIIASVVQKMYGGRKINFEIGLSQLIDFCRINGCEVYVGIETLEENKISGTAMMVNRSLGYNHLISFSTNIKILENPDKYKMDIQVYAYVPIHNINTLYNEKTIKKSTK